MSKTKKTHGRNATVVAIYPVAGTQEFAFRVQTTKGSKYGHRYDRRRDARRGALSLIAALRGRVVIRTLDFEGNQVSESVFLPGTVSIEDLLRLVPQD